MKRMDAVSSLGSGIGATRPAKDPRWKPTAVSATRRTAEENRPFFTKNAAAQGTLAGIQKGVAIGGKPDYEVSDRVRHIKYGVGTVTKLEQGPRDYQVTVDFDSAGTKVMYAGFAKLKKV